MAMSVQEMETTYTLKLAPNFTPEANAIIAGNGLACFGMPGSGKSNMLALLCEQYAALHLPLVVLDTENESADLLSVFPRGIHADKNTLPDPYAILHTGQQVILNLKSWDEDYEGAATAICSLIEGLFREAGKQSPLDRVPCPIIMDEAATWLPRRTKRVAHLSKETKTLLLTVFERLGSRGRKYGLIPHYFAQYVSQVDVDVMRGCQVKVLMKQTDPRDLKRYADFLPMGRELKKAIFDFVPGEAFIVGQGEPFQVRFYEQMTDHPSQTPKVESALLKFQGRIASKQASYGHAESVLATLQSRKQEPRAKVLAFPTKPKPVDAGPSQTLLEQAFKLLDQDEDLNPYQLSNNIGCSVQTAAIAKQIWLEK